MIEIQVTAKLSEQDVKSIAKEVAIIQAKDKVKAKGVKEESETFYTVNEVAKKLKKQPQTIRYHINNGLLAATKTGKSWTITENNLKLYASNGE
jgi:excisionase family DNA binding protein